MGQQQFVNIDAQLARIAWVQRMLRVNKRSLSAGLLYFSNGMQGNCRLTRRFRSVHFNNPAFRKAADSKRNIKSQRSARHDFDLHMSRLAQLHNGTFTELFLNLTKRHLQRCTTI
ncbi:hypothetical protein D3C73_1464220 [compost metagenome]